MALSREVVCVCLLAVAAIVSCSPTLGSGDELLEYAAEDLESESRVAALFEAWNQKHGKKYPEGGSAEKERRFKIFQDNLNYINQHNSKGSSSSYTLGLTRFADLTNQEFKSSGFFGASTQYNGQLELTPHEPAAQYGQLGSCDTSGLPLSWDWRDKGVVTAVKNQGQCGSCWAFSAVGAIESANAMRTGNLIRLSEQQLVSCDTTNYGCNGGWDDNAFAWVVRNRGIASEADYPYEGTDSTCRQVLNISASISGYVRVTPFDESALLCAVAVQPVAITISASGSDFQLYRGGVFNGSCSTTIDHAILLVGWGVSSNGAEYWICKNSWGTWWGSAGYIYLAKGIGITQGICGMYTRSSYPVATTPPWSCDERISCGSTSETCCCVVGSGSNCITWGCCPAGYPICVPAGPYCMPDTPVRHPLMPVDVSVNPKHKPRATITAHTKLGHDVDHQKLSALI